MKKLNPYITNIKRVEFTINNSCTSRCKHCSQGRLKANHVIDEYKATKALEAIAKVYDVKSIMTFGGEALIYPEKVCMIHKMAKECEIPTRQLITNGCFSKNPERICEVAKKLEESGVNHIMLSVDCFHEEHLPLSWVRQFAEALVQHYTGKLHIHPAWVRSETDDNPYNERTRQCIAYLEDLQIPLNDGNVIFPEGNAVKNLPEYFEKKTINMNFKCGEAPYSTALDKVSELMIDCNGDVLPCSFSIGNINHVDIIEIIEQYNPYQNPYTKALIEKGVAGLVEVAKEKGIKLDLEAYYTPCAICKAIAING